MAATPVRVGDKLKTPGRLGVDHYGVYVGVRPGYIFGVVHNSKALQQVVLEEWSTFCAGSPVYVTGRAAVGFEEAVASVALAYVGKRYNLFLFNCEHFANLVVHGQEVSPQLEKAAKRTMTGAAIGTAAVLGSIALGVGLVADSSIGGFRNKRTGKFAKTPPLRKPPRKRGRKR